jgi:hypothetical protein
VVEADTDPTKPETGAGHSAPAGPESPAGPGSSPGSAAPASRSLGLREALLVGELVVVVVLLAGVATFLLPGDGRNIVLRTPLLILVLIGGTAGVLWRISRPARPDR